MLYIFSDENTVLKVRRLAHIEAMQQPNNNTIYNFAKDLYHRKFSNIH